MKNNPTIIHSRRVRAGAIGVPAIVARISVCLAILGAITAPLEPAARAAEQPQQYRIGAGDILNVEIVGRRDLSAQYAVGQDGVLFMPLLGGVPVEGKTAADLGAELGRRLSLYDRDITQVNVSVAEFRSRKIYVLGAVLRPGKYSFAELPSVWDAIGEAGGPTEDAQLSAVEVIPGDLTAGRMTAVLDVAAAIKEGRLQSLERLKPGDTVRVPRGGGVGTAAPSANTVYLFGAIVRQGALSLEKATDLMTAVIQSGGATPDADLTRIDIVRKNGGRAMQMRVNMDDYISKALPAGNPTLLPGDQIYLRRTGGGSTGFVGFIRTYSPLLALATSIIVLAGRFKK
jgi:polysaccharide export outer membrane protein